MHCTSWKVSVFEVFLIHIFPHLDWIRRDIPYLSVFCPNAGKCDPEKPRIWTLFTQCCFSQFFWKSVIILTDVRKILIYNLLKYLKASSTFSSNKPYFSSNELILKLDTSSLTYHQIIPQIWRRLLLCSINVLTSTFSKC